VVSQVSESDEEAGDMEEGVIHRQRAFVSHHQAAEVAQPGEGALDFPATPIAPQRSSILRGRLAPVLAMRTDQMDAAAFESAAQRVAVVGPVGDEALGLALGPAPSSPWHLNLGQRPLDQRHLCGRGAVQVVSQRNTLAVDHHHPLRALAALGFADAGTPFLAGAKLPSKKLSLQSNRPRWSSSRRKARQI